jgi:serine/threonine-protein kinase RsbW
MIMKDQPRDLIELTIPAKADYVGVVRLAISGIATRMGFSYDDIEDLKLAVAEACTNAVHHAYRGEGGEISICCNLYVDRLEIEIIDQGCSFDVSAVEAKTGPINGRIPYHSLRERGLGLYLMKSLMDRVEIKGDNGVVVTLTKYIRRDEVEADVDSPTETRSH